MLPVQTQPRKRKHTRRNIVLIVAIVIVVIGGIVWVNSALTLYGCFCGTEQMAAEVVGCHVVNQSCSIILTNLGDVSQTAVRCYYGDDGNTTQGVLESNGGIKASNQTVGADTHLTAVCRFVGSPLSGAQAVGGVEFLNGEVALFSGIWA